ncbi:MAG: AI-2E family transporter, partial [Proteiniclasticum sp.]|nr:AI-2E family transporter [Proteiniclasticum sp.]
LSSIALLILGVEYWLILGMLAGIGDLIPYIGPFLGAIPAVFIALTTDPWKAVWVIVAFLIIQQLEGNLISPKIVGHSVGLHPALIIFMLLVGGALWGLVGLLVAVPLAGVIKVLLEAILDWFKKHYPSIFEAS